MTQMLFFNASDHAISLAVTNPPSSLFYATVRTVASSALAKYSTLPSFRPAIDMREEQAM